VPKPWVAIGAHYDHLGRGSAAFVTASAERALVHHGADDNASGTAAVLNIAEALARQPRKRHLLLGFWSGEELGIARSAGSAAPPPARSAAPGLRLSAASPTTS
jgi:Zn-dependent M28 family amino/carboxypeptidase